MRTKDGTKKVMQKVPGRPGPPRLTDMASTSTAPHPTGPQPPLVKVALVVQKAVAVAEVKVQLKQVQVAMVQLELFIIQVAQLFLQLM